MAVVRRFRVACLMLFQQCVETLLEACLERFAFASALALRLECFFKFWRFLVHYEIGVRIVVKVVVFKSVHSFFLASHSSRRIEHTPQVGIFHAPRLAFVAVRLVERCTHFTAPGHFCAVQGNYLGFISDTKGPKSVHYDNITADGSQKNTTTRSSFALRRVDPCDMPIWPIWRW